MDNPEFHRVTQEDLAAGLDAVACVLCRRNFAVNDECAVIPTEAVHVVMTEVPVHSMCAEAAIAGVVPESAAVHVIESRKGLPIAEMASAIREAPEQERAFMLEALRDLVRAIETGEDPDPKWQDVCPEHGFECPNDQDQPDMYDEIARFLEGA